MSTYKFKSGDKVWVNSIGKKKEHIQIYSHLTGTIVGVFDSTDPEWLYSVTFPGFASPQVLREDEMDKVEFVLPDRPFQIGTIFTDPERGYGDPGVWIDVPDSGVEPDHYKFPSGVEVRQVSAYLTSFGGQALQYVARATRLDGANKGNPVEDLKKAVKFIEWEIDRLEAGND